MADFEYHELRGFGRCIPNLANDYARVHNFFCVDVGITLDKVAIFGITTRESTLQEKTVKKRWKEDSAKFMTELSEVIAVIEDFSIE